jgi:hypothetical protein
MDFIFPELPPVMFLTLVTDHCPEAASLYIKLWNKKDSENQSVILHEDIRMEFLESTTRFRNFLFRLLKESLVNFEERDDSFCIELVGWDTVNEVV